MNWYKKYIYARVPALDSRKFKKMLRDMGAYYLRPGSGSHEIWEHPNGRHGTVQQGTIMPSMAKKIIERELGLDYNQFLSNFF